MRKRWLLDSTAPSCALVLAVLVQGCGGASTTSGSSSGGASNVAGTGGSVSSGASGASQSGGSSGAPAAGTTSCGGANGSGGATSSGAATSSGGATGSGGAAIAGAQDPGAAGEAGAPASCSNFCDRGSGCCSPELRCVASIPTCRLDVYDAEIDTTYRYNELEQKVAALPKTWMVSITDAEILSALADSEPSGRFELALTAEASAAHGAALLDMNDHPFVFSCDDRPLFLGVGYMREGAAALDTPVLHVAKGPTGAITLRLGAYQGRWYSSGVGGELLSERIDRPELRAALCARSILGELKQ